MFAGPLDIERCIFNLYRKGVPLEALKIKADEYREAGYISIDMARQVIRLIEEERGQKRIANQPLLGPGEAPPGDAQAEESVSSRLNAAALRRELAEREDEKAMREKGIRPDSRCRDRQQAPP